MQRCPQLKIVFYHQCCIQPLYGGLSALPHSSEDPNQLLPKQYIFDIFLNASTPSVIYNNTDLILPLDPPDTL